VRLKYCRGPYFAWASRVQTPNRAGPFGCFRYKIMMFPFRGCRLVPLLLLGMAAARPAAAQKYRTAAGLRMSSGLYGLTVQQKFLPKATLEGLALAGSREITGTVLAERHFGILGPSLNYYVGAGGHVGRHKDTGTFGGFDAIVGVEYKIAFSRLVVSADFKPSVEFNSDDWARFPTAFSVRYIIIKEKRTGLFDGVFGGKDRKDRDKPRKKKKSAPRRGLFDW
jgi:hypothetical protein